MKLKAVLGIKDSAGKKTRKYRIQDIDTNEVKDVSIDKIREVLSKGVNIKNLQLINNEIQETAEIQKIPEIRRSSISLYEWCMQNGERGQRILKEFNEGGNWPITDKDISCGSTMKIKFRCTKCHKVNVQIIENKTGPVERGCKYCSGRQNTYSGITLEQWCNNHGDYGKNLLQEYIQGNNPMPPNQISYGSRGYANFKCQKCGGINRQLISSKTRECNAIGCKYCNTSKTSIGEQLIFLWLQSQNIKVYNQYKIKTYLGDKEFDIYIPTMNLTIEHQSNRHADISTQFNDDKAVLIAQSLGFHLLEICLVDSQYQRQPNHWCITYKLNHEYGMIQQLSKWLNTNYNLNTNPNYSRALEDQAYLNSCKVKPENSLAVKRPDLAKEWNYQLNGAVTPDKVSLNSQRKYYWTCSTCNHIYLASPLNRNNGRACPNYRRHK